MGFDSDIDVLIITHKARTTWDKAVIAPQVHEMLGLANL
jgi:predicted nucleotidyltransferase